MPTFASDEGQAQVKAPTEAGLSELLWRTGTFRTTFSLPVNQHSLLCFKDSHFAAPALLQHF